MNYTFDFNAVSLAPLLQGLWVSLELTAAANIIGIVFGFALALLIMSPFRVVR
ncbi:MAG: amino acid ABC transporter permease, partial [Pararhizobium sp.]